MTKVLSWLGLLKFRPCTCQICPSKTVWQIIADLLAKARETSRDGAVAQYLVGAKLQLRFPNLTIGNESYSTADAPTDRPGDFTVGNTVFHVTVAPALPVYNKCLDNLQRGYRVFLLVSSDVALQKAKGYVDTVDALREKVSIESIETFVSQNLEELSEFKADKLKGGFRMLLENYNKRVDRVETDKSMMIEIPPNLLR